MKCKNLTELTDCDQRGNGLFQLEHILSGHHALRQVQNDDTEFDAVVREYENSSGVDVTGDLWAITNANLETMENIILNDSGVIPTEQYAYLAARVMRKFTVHPVVTYNDWPITVDIAMTEVGMCHILNSNMAIFNNPLEKLDTSHEIWEVYGPHAVSVTVSQNWFKRFQSGNFDDKDEPLSGRPVTD
ncbi:hypothetical protein EVAR_81344_1 [Eumeta japonica]|uniref:Uncharacterized protein n=1 Tax=Eumeta variegata TaxID=151549 RepID=A0A4C1XCV5_EUMVA|nr:hypothetical protein EVAR_81344_1 [Eumeta japonica]